MKQVKVTQNPENEVTFEILAESIKSISDGVKAMRKSRLNDKALILLIQAACPTFGHYPKQKPSAKVVETVIETMENLEKTYLKDKS